MNQSFLYFKSKQFLERRQRFFDWLEFTFEGGGGACTHPKIAKQPKRMNSGTGKLIELVSFALFDYWLHFIIFSQ